jgi:hypothetical protein
MSKNKIELIYFKENKIFNVVNSPMKRNWMNETDSSYAYKCVPLNAANQYGWNVLCPIDFTAEWNGGQKRQDIKVSVLNDDNDDEDLVGSHFGHGVLTFYPDFIVRTNKNTSLYIRGVPNLASNGIQPLDAIVETDWLPFTFTYNLRFTRPGKIRFYKDQPIFNFFPLERNYIQSFEAKTSKIEEHPDLNKEFEIYSNFRNFQLKTNDTTNTGLYGKMESPIKKYDVENHEKIIKLSKFNTEEDYDG